MAMTRQEKIEFVRDQLQNGRHAWHHEIKLDVAGTCVQCMDRAEHIVRRLDPSPHSQIVSQVGSLYNEGFDDFLAAVSMNDYERLCEETGWNDNPRVALFANLETDYGSVRLTVLGPPNEPTTPRVYGRRQGERQIIGPETP
jgi:hypothetical protein